MNTITVTPINESEIQDVAMVHKEVFQRQKLSNDWIQCHYRAWPKSQVFAAKIGEEVVGYIIWGQKSGFREEVVLELEQLAILSPFRGQGYGKTLIKESLNRANQAVENFGSTLKHIMITTRADNEAQQLYKSVLGAEVEATITGLYSSDEVIMVARDVQL